MNKLAHCHCHFQAWTSRAPPFVCFTYGEPVPNLQCVPTDTSSPIEQLSANTGSEDSAKRVRIQSQFSKFGYWSFALSGDSCEFLHEFDMSKMPECYFYSKFRACSNKECPFLHIDPESKVKDCPWYDRGFCRHGPTCRHRHARRVACLSYLCGFCPDGPSCKFVHMRFDIPSLTGPTTGGVMVSATGNAITGLGPDPSQQQQPQQQQSSFNQPDTKRRGVICHHCNEPGHKIYVCPSIPPDQRDDVIAKFAAEQVCALLVAWHFMSLSCSKIVF